MTPMLATALYISLGCFAFAQLCCLYRVVFAPGLTDRVLALDTMSINMIALLTLFGIRQGTGVYFEASLLFAMTGFVATVAYCRFVLRGNIIE